MTMLSSKNFRLLGAAVALLVVGFVLLGQGPVRNPLSWTVAPLILVGVYCIMIPFAILSKEKHGKNAQGEKGV